MFRLIWAQSNRYKFHEVSYIRKVSSSVQSQWASARQDVSRKIFRLSIGPLVWPSHCSGLLVGGANARNG